jgi:hypothetical protein
MRRIVLFLALSFIAFRADATITRGTQNTTTACTTSSLTCSLTIASTTAGQLGVLILDMTDLADLQKVQSITGCGNWLPVPASQSPGIVRGQEEGGLAAWWNYSETGSCTSVTVHLTADATNGYTLIHNAYTTTASYLWINDPGGQAYNPSGTKTGATIPALTGSTCLEIQFAGTGVGNSITAVGSSYANTYFNATNGAVGVGDLINISTAVTPSWTLTSSKMVVGAAAFCEASSLPTTPYVVSQTTCYNGGSGVSPCSLYTTSVAGHALIVNVTSSTTGTGDCTAVSASSSGSLTYATGTNVGNSQVGSAPSIWTIFSITGGDTSISATCGHAADQIWVWEIANAAGIESGTPCGAENSASTSTTGCSITTTHSSSFILQCESGSTGVSGMTSATYFGEGQLYAYSANDCTGYITPSSGTYNASWYNSGGSSTTNSSNGLAVYATAAGPPSNQFPRVN